MPNTSSAKKMKQGAEPPIEGSHMTLFPSLPDDVSLHILALLPRISYTTLALVCRAWRNALCNGPVFATRNRLNLSEPWIVFVSERDEGFEFLFVDPAHRGCLKVARPHPEPLDSAPSSVAFYTHPMAAGNEILMPAPSYLVGRLWQDFNPDIMYCFNVQSMGWTKPVSLLTRRPYRNCYSAFAFANMDGYLYVAGGNLDGITKKAARLDIASRRWEALPDLTEARLHASAVVLQGRMYIIGGFHPSNSVYKIVGSGEMWDPISREWTLIPELWPADVFANKGSYIQSVAVVKDKLYALRPESPWMPQELMYYEDASKVWISMGKFSFSRLVKSKCALTLRNQHCRLVGVMDMLFVFCCAKPVAGTKPKNGLLQMVALYVKPTLSEPLIWGIWPLSHPVDNMAIPVIAYG